FKFFGLIFKGCLDQSALHSEEDIRLIEKLLYDNSSPRLPEEFVSANSEAASKSFSPSPILVRDSDSLIEEIDLLCTLDYPMPSGIMDKDYDSERDILITKDLPSNNTLSFAKKKDSDSLMKEIDLFCTPDYPMPPGIEDDDYDSKRDILILKDFTSNNTLSFAEKRVKDIKEKDKIRAKTDQTGNGKRGKVKSQQKVKPDKVEAKKIKKSKGIKIEGLKIKGFQITYQGPMIPNASSSLPQVVERETEVTKDTVPPTNNESTKDVQPPVFQTETPILNSEPVVNLDSLTNNVLIPLDGWTSGLLVYKSPLSVRMTKVIKGEFEKIKDVKVEDVSLTCDTSPEVFNNEVNRLSEMDDDLLTYEVEVANIPCDLKIDDDSKNEADDSTQIQ
nr:reverse transcriptase domain-containing protein [Tanacetum cinerariifolium]